MQRKAVIISEGSNYCICCDVGFIEEFYSYVVSNDEHRKEMNEIFDSIHEKLTSKKYGNEPYGTMSMKPFLGKQNDRIICNIQKRPNKSRLIIMAELFPQKKTQQNDRRIDRRYKIVSSYKYEIIGNP
ncbi:hypothetical protein [Gaetbulibacter jejuensis]|uniref:Uncharacterized protein n=1 Tax=Gaetbulibacter jejuensis TaxID=584607 RepID=A0ABN1JD91_9FLAO